MLNADDLVVLLTFASVTLFVTTLTFATLWVRARERVLRHAAERRMGDPDERIDRLMTAVDAVAIEVERISEGQRFTTQVLAQRMTDAIEPRRVPERVITPH